VAIKLSHVGHIGTPYASWWVTVRRVNVRGRLHEFEIEVADDRGLIANPSTRVPRWPAGHAVAGLTSAAREHVTPSAMKEMAVTMRTTWSGTRPDQRITGEHHGHVGQHHAECGADDHEREVMELCRQRHRGDLRPCRPSRR
jgi:hypothetical protein